MKISINYIFLGVVALTLIVIFANSGQKSSILGDKEALIQEKKRLKEQREEVEIQVDSITAFMECICQQERLSCGINRSGKNLVCTFDKDEKRDVESAFLCGLALDKLEDRLDFKEDEENLILTFNLRDDFVILPSIVPACLPSKRKLCND